MEQLVIVLIIGAISLGKWLLEKSAEQRTARKMGGEPGRPRPVAPPLQAPRPIAQPLPDMEKAARRLREALGLPEESELPKPAKRREGPPPVPPRQAAGTISPPADLERRILGAAPAVEPVSPPTPAPSAPVAAAPAPARTELEQLLRSRDGLRRAMLAREILGPPKGLVF